jgi:hypothetical protein
MKNIIFLLLLLPALGQAQFKRSATELAKENIEIYLTKKVFQHRLYEPISFEEINAVKKNDQDIEWSIVHTFLITENKMKDEKLIPVQQSYKFVFYFNRKMEVVKAESF